MLNANLSVKIREKFPTLPPDAVDAAARGMLSLFGYGRGLGALRDNLLPNETVQAICQCDIPRRGRNAQGIIALTDQRIIAAGWVAGIIGANVLDVVQISDVSNVDMTTKILNAELVIQVPGGGIAVTGIHKDRARWFVDSFRTLKAAQTPTPAVPWPPSDVGQRLEQLGDLHRQGLISEDEYQAKRRAILDEL
jgi:hypothetical protein